MAFNGKTSLIKNEECFSSGVCMAEREGFEPSIGVKAYTPLAGERLQPLGHLSEEGILYCKYIERVFRNRPFDKYYPTISKS